MQIIARALDKKVGEMEVGKKRFKGFPAGSVVKNPPTNAEDTGSIPGPRRSHILWSN